MNITIKQYEQAADETVSIGGIKWVNKWDVCIQCNSREEAESIQTQLNRDWDADAYGYAKRLADALYQKHYTQDSPEWKPLDTTLGVLTQIDNMASGLVKKPSEQKPVVWMYQDKSTNEVRFQKHMRDFVDHGQTYETPLYANEWAIPLKDGTNIKYNPTENNSDYERGFIDGMQKQMQSSVDKAVNSIAKPEPEPVAWQSRMRPDWEENGWTQWKDCPKEQADNFWKAPHLHDWVYEARALYTAPPQRKWQGLTDEEIKKEQHHIDWTNVYTYAKFARAIEAKLKEKNNG